MRQNLMFFAVLLAGTWMQAQVITVSTTQYTHEQLITEVLVDTPCAIVDNITSITGTDFGFGSGIGYFENTNPNFPIESGLILASGEVQYAPGPADDENWGNGSNAWLGDTQLLNYLNSLGIGVGHSLHNASIMEFDFTPLTDSISFNFVFGSNEYGAFQCDYSDAFAFFLENSDTGEIVNMALVPNTPVETPISVTTIRDNLYNTFCASQNPEYFDVFYGANGQPPGTAPVNLRGHTVLMQAWQYVEPGVVYKMKLVIADRRDSLYDSAVFIEGGSFFIGNADLGDDLTIANGNAPCDDSQVELSVTVGAEADIKWFKDGVEIPGETSDTLIVTEAGLYGVEISDPAAPDCIMADEVLIEFKKSAIFDLGEDIDICGAVSVTLDATPDNLDDLPEISYKWFLDGVEIVGETDAQLEANQIGEYTAEVHTEQGCVTTDTINVVLINYTVTLGDNQVLCDGESYEIVPVVNGIDPAVATYLWSTGETTYSIIASETGTYTVEVSYLDCVETASVDITFTDLPQVSLGEDFKKCADEVVLLEATLLVEPSPDVVYTWYYNGGIIGGNTTTIEITEAGTYTVVVDDNGCQGSDEVEISFYANQNCVITQGISPNNDGYNDFFDLEFLRDRYGTVHLYVYNRHGVELYAHDNYVNEWYGQDKNGNIMPEGTYYYVLAFENNEPITGYVYINK